MTTRGIMALWFVLIVFGLINPVDAKLPAKQGITDVVIKNDKVSNKDKKEKLRALNSADESMQLTSTDSEEINSVFNNYSNSLNEIFL